jgi:hypothetical protein
MVLETQRPVAAVFRLGRKPDPWQSPPWSLANPSDGTFGNRFDDPEAYYRVLYASTQRLACFVETLARFRPDLTLLADLQEIEGDDDYTPLGTLPPEWLEQRLMGQATLSGDFAAIYSVSWVGHLRRVLAQEALRIGFRDIDVGILERAEPRSLTQLASREVYRQGLDGICYRSRYGHSLENWAIFEPFNLRPGISAIISAKDTDLSAALSLHGIRLG